MFTQNYKLNEQGLNHFFGPLEAKIMEIVWATEGITIKDVQQRLSEESPVNFNTVMTVMNRLVEKAHLEKHIVKRSGMYRTTQTKEEFLSNQTKKMTQELMGEFGDLVVNHMIDELEQADPSLIKKLEEKLSRLKKRTDKMKWQMRKIVLLAVTISVLFLSMLVYYVTYPFLFQNKAFFLSQFCLFELQKHMRELSILRIMIAGLLLFTVIIMSKRIWKQFFYSKRLKRNLVSITRKGKQVYVLSTLQITAFTIGLFRPKIVISEGMFQAFSEEEIDAIVLHEEYHQKNRDPLKLFFFTLLAEGMMYIPILKGMLQRYHVYQELSADKYAMQKMKSSFELGSALLKLIKIKTMENQCITASFAKTAINLRIEQVLNEKVVKLNIPLHTNSVYVTLGLFCMSIVLIVGECI